MLPDPERQDLKFPDFPGKSGKFQKKSGKSPKYLQLENWSLNPKIHYLLSEIELKMIIPTVFSIVMLAEVITIERYERYLCSGDQI